MVVFMWFNWTQMVSRKRAPRTAVVYLSQGGPHTSYNTDTFVSLRKSLGLLVRNAKWTQDRSVDVWVFGDYDANQTRALKEIMPKVRVSSIPREHWMVPVPMGEWAYMRHFSLGYRLMIQWWAIEAFTWAAQLRYQCLVRFDDDSYVLSEMKDPCIPIFSGDAEYVCRAPIRDTFEGASDFRAKANRVLGKTIDHDKRIDCYNNFFAMDVAYSQTPEYQRFIEEFREDMFKWRLNDAILQSIAVQALFPHGITFVNWFTYEHARENMHMTGGIYRGEGDTNWTEHVQDFQKRHWRLFKRANVDGWLMGRNVLAFDDSMRIIRY